MKTKDIDLGDAISELEKFVGIWATFDSLFTTQWNITRLGKLSDFYVIFLAMGLISSYRSI